MAIAKTTRPRLSGVFARRRLFRLLDSGRNRPITWVQGPPGAGKTTLVASYLESRKQQCLWYQVDEGDGDIASFFYHLRQAAPRRRRPLPLLTPEYFPGLTVFTQRFFRQLYARLNTPFVLVLDNYQDALTNSNFHEVIAEALAQLPNEGYAIVISRSGPPPSMARLRASGALSSVGGPKLRLTFDEAKGLARSITEDRISGATLKSIYETVDGWTAGLVLLLERMKSEHRAITQASGRTPQEVFDYFASEIFHKSSRDTRQILLQTAFLPRVTASVAEKLTGLSSAGQIIDELSQEHYFTNKHEGPEPTYQYHPLFREFLLSQAEKMLTPDQQILVQKVAAALLVELGQYEGAVDLFHKVQDWESLAGLVQGQAPILMKQGRIRTIFQWLTYFPSGFIEGRPWLLYWLGSCRLALSFGLGRESLEKSFELFWQQKDPTGTFLSWSANVDSIQFWLTDAGLLDRWIAVGSKVLKRFRTFPSVEIEAAFANSTLAALLYRQPQSPDIPYWASRVSELAQIVSDPYRRMQLTMMFALYSLWAGQFARAKSVLEPLRQLGSQGAVNPAHLWALFTIARCEWIEGHPERAVKTVSAALAMAETTGVYQANHLLRCEGAIAALSMGDEREADKLIGDVTKSVEERSKNDLAIYNYALGWRALRKGNLELAFKQHELTLDHATQLRVPLVEALARLFSVHVLHERGDEQQALQHLSRCLEIARGAKARFIEFMGLLLEAQIAFDQRQESNGLESLSSAMKLGREFGYFNTYTWRPEVMVQLCIKALEANVEPAYIQELIRKRGLVPKAPPVEIEQWPWPIKIFTLGRFTVLKDDQPVQFSRKTQRRPLELLKAIIAFGGRSVSESQIIEVLWPDAEGDVAQQSFSTTLHRLRRLLGRDDVIERQEGKLTLDARLCWVDVWAVERLLSRVEAAISRTKRNGAVWPELIRLIDKATELYHGPFLQGEDMSWATPVNDRIRPRLLRAIGELGQHSENSNQWQSAISYYERALQINPCAEPFYQRLMVSCQKLGDISRAAATYERCRKTLLTMMGIAPSSQTEALQRRLLVG